MADSFTDFTNVDELLDSITDTPVVEAPTEAQPPQEQELSPALQAIQAKLYLSMKSREGKMTLLDAYITRLRGVVC